MTFSEELADRTPEGRSRAIGIMVALFSKGSCVPPAESAEPIDGTGKAGVWNVTCGGKDLTFVIDGELRMLLPGHSEMGSGEGAAGAPHSPSSGPGKGSTQGKDGRG
jgi:hypothetical protein